jgi:hypothetical protein
MKLLYSTIREKKKTYKKLRVGILVYEYVEGVDGKN